jgi:hypothetical protein
MLFIESAAARIIAEIYATTENGDMKYVGANLLAALRTCARRAHSNSLGPGNPHHQRSATSEVYWNIRPKRSWE